MTASSNTNLQVAVIDIEGMTCNHCAQTVQKSLTTAPGVTHASIDLTRNEAHVTFDSSLVSIAALMQAVNHTGFKAVAFTRGPARPND